MSTELPLLSGRTIRQGSLLYSLGIHNILFRAAVSQKSTPVPSGAYCSAAVLHFFQAKRKLGAVSNLESGLIKCFQSYEPQLLSVKMYI